MARRCYRPGVQKGAGGTPQRAAKRHISSKASKAEPVYRLKYIAGTSSNLHPCSEWARCPVPPAPEPCISNGRQAIYRVPLRGTYRHKFIAGTNNQYSRFLRVGVQKGAAGTHSFPPVALRTAKPRSCKSPAQVRTFAKTD